MTNLRDRDREIYNQELRREELRRDNQIARENNSAAGGLLTGILLATLVALGLGALFVFNRGGDNSEPAGRQTIIERTKEVVPVPQPQAPDVQPPDVNITVPKVEAPKAPDVNVTIPSPAAPAAETAPADSAAPTGDATSTGSTSGDTAPAQP